MARSKSDDKRTALMTAAIQVIAAEGLSAPTAAISGLAGVSAGSLFTYFPTKIDLHNALYLDLKTAMLDAALTDIALPPESGMPTDLRNVLARVWSNWTRWGVAHPEARRTLELLGTADYISPQTRAAVYDRLAPMTSLIQHARAAGPLRDAPGPYVAALVVAVADTTMLAMRSDPANADRLREFGFAVFWRMLTGPSSP